MRNFQKSTLGIKTFSAPATPPRGADTRAIDDLAAGRAFYDHQNPGVGDYFFDSLFAEIDSLVLYGGTHPIRHGHFRMLARRFPHAIYYKIANAEVTVHRIIDCRRDPKWIQRQLKRPPSP